MKHVYPPRHPASLDADAPGAASSSRDGDRAPDLPHDRDESSHSQAPASPRQQQVGRRAYDDATDGTADTDRGPVMDQVYNDRIASDRGSGSPRQ